MSVSESSRMRIDLKGRAGKLQDLGTQVVHTLYMIVKNTRLYDADNEIFSQPLRQLTDLVNTVIALDKRFEIQASGTLLSLNGQLVRFPFNALENVRFLTGVFKDANMGGFSLERATNINDLRELIRSLNSKMEDDEETLNTHVTIKRTKHARIVARLKNQNNKVASPQKVDRKKYALTVYARAIYYMRDFLKNLSRDREQEERPIPDMNPSSRIVRDFVDICAQERTHFLGLTATRNSEDYLSYHLVNTCLLSIVLGTELGLSKDSLLDLGKAALFHDIGVLSINEGLLDKTGVLTKDERKHLHQAPLLAAKILMRGRPLDLSSLKCILTAHEAKLSYQVSAQGTAGAAGAHYVPRPNLGVYGRIVHVAATFDALTSTRPYRDALTPQKAFKVMAVQMRNEFDPLVLRVFALLVSRQKMANLPEGATIEVV